MQAQTYNYTFRALSPLFTGAGTQLGIKSELRKQRVKVANPEAIPSIFKTEKDRETALVDVLTLLYAEIDPDYRMKRGKDIWGEYKSGLLMCCGSKSISAFMTRFATHFKVRSYNTDILKYFKLFNDAEFLQSLSENIDYILTVMRYNREQKNEHYKKINLLEKQIDFIQEAIEKHADDMFYDIEEDRIKLKEKWDELKSLELSKSGLLFDVDNYEQGESIYFQKDFDNIPLFSGNTIAGILRRIAMYDYLDAIDVKSMFDFTYHTLFTGGTLTEKVNEDFIARLEEITSNIQDKLHIALKTPLTKGESAEIVVDKTEKLAYLCPPLRLFGSATKAGMIESEFIVANARLKCKENGNGNSSVWSLIEDVFYTRLDSEKKERELEVLNTSEQLHQMKYIVETLIEGSEFEHSFVLKSTNPFVYNCFHAVLKLFVEYHRIGGKSARGLGDIDLSELYKQIDFDAVSEYYKHLKENKEQMQEFLGVTVN